MNSLRRILRLLAFAAASAVSAASAVPPDALTLWYRIPGTPTLMEGLPVGNGRLGALVAGGVTRERIALSEQTVWSGGPHDFDNPAALSGLAESRRLLFAGRYAEADALIRQKLVCKWGPEIMDFFGNFQTLGFLDLAFDNHEGNPSDYRRELDLATAAARVRYTVKGVTYTREVIASAPDGVIALRLTTDRPGALGFTANLGRPAQPEENFPATSGRKLTDPVVVSADGPAGLVLRGRLYQNDRPDGLRFLARLRVTTEGGAISTGPDGLTVSGADSATLILVASTDYQGRNPEAASLATLAAIAAKPYPALRAAQSADHAALFSRVAIDLAPVASTTAAANSLPTDERLAAFARGELDPAFAALYFQLGRYLLISSSRPGGLPANLQGLWAETIRTPWHGAYTANINLQMNYWAAESANLAETAAPLHAFIAGLVEPGSRTARIHYDAPGWVAPVHATPWGFTSPGQNPGWGLFPLSAAWLCRHLWENFEYEGDTAALRRSWPVMKGAAEFVLAWLVPDPATGRLVSGPANSPENRFIAPDGTETSFSMGPSMDQEIAWDLFTNVLATARALEIEDAFTTRVAAALANLQAPRVGPDGRLLEWAQDYREIDPHHRHISHLFSLYPGRQFTRADTPAMVEAARRSLDARGDAGTGWSLAWKMALRARLGDGDRALAHLRTLLRPVEPVRTLSMSHGGTYPNLLCAHPPMQIDGNLGATAALVELLLQSHETLPDGRRIIRLLPALPSAWPEGSVSGLRARGGLTLSLRWSAGRITEARFTASRPATFVLRLTDRDIPINALGGETLDLDSARLSGTLRLASTSQLPAGLINTGTIEYLVPPVPKVLSFNLNAPDATLEIEAYPFWNFQLQRSLSLQPADWLTLGSARNGVTGPMSFTEMLPAGAPTVFYRVRVPPLP
jgi:alpha-L-fucosidase 2